MYGPSEVCCQLSIASIRSEILSADPVQARIPKTACESEVQSVVSGGDLGCVELASGVVVRDLPGYQPSLLGGDSVSTLQIMIFSSRIRDIRKLISLPIANSAVLKTL